MTRGKKQRGNDSLSPARSEYLAVAFVAASLIAYQINLVQIFSYMQWYHFAYMAISIALLGFGAAGSFLTIFQRHLFSSYTLVFSCVCVMTSISMALLMLLRGSAWWGFEAYHLEFSAGALLKLMRSYLLLIVPFFFGALALGMAFTRYAAHIGRLYASDLGGSGIGALIAVLLSYVAFPHRAEIIVAILPLIAGALTLPRKRKWWWVPPGNVVCLVVVYIFTGTPRPSEYKPLSKTLLLPDARIEYSQPHPEGVLQVVSSPVLRNAPGISMTYSGTVPVVKGVFRNGEWTGALGDQSVTDSTHILDYSGFALPFAIGSYDNILVADDPTASMVQYALDHAPSNVVSILKSSDLTDLIRVQYPGATDSVWYDPRSVFEVGHMRSWLLTAKARYDLIILPAIGQFGSTGLRATQEEYIFTRENLALLWQHLTGEGVFVVGCWLDVPARAPLRLFNLLADMLVRQGIDNPLDHIIAVKNWGMVTFVVRKAPWTAGHHRGVDEFCAAMHFDPLVNRGTIGTQEEMLHVTEDTSFTVMLRSIAAGDKQVVRSYDFDISVTTDDSPYFYKFMKIMRIGKVLGVYGRQGLFVELGYFFVLATLVMLALFALVLIVLPLFSIGFKGARRGFTLIYFAAIGIGYMCVEIAFLHQGIPYLGSPVNAFATTLAALLIASALGSYYVERGTRQRSLQWYGVTLILLLFVYNLTAGTLWNIIGQAGILRIPATAMMIGIPGFFMGMFFPSGIRLLSKLDSDAMIPWAWGVNGFFSVISAVLALILAIELGFANVIVLAIVAYGMALVAILSTTSWR